MGLEMRLELRQEMQLRQDTPECKLGQALGCEGLKANGTCGVYSPEGVALRMEQGFCVFKNIRSANVGIYATKRGKKRNPLKLAKAVERGKVTSPEEA